MDWKELLLRSIENHTIRELYLYQLQILKTCNNWPAVKEIGRVDFKGKHANYNGGIVQYGGKFYFVPDITLQALASYRKWNFKNTIRVLTEEDYQKVKLKKKIFAK